MNYRYQVVGRDGHRYLFYRLLMENALGRELQRGEHVHHINGDPTDNRIENLEVLTASEHTRRHNPRHTHCCRGHLYDEKNTAYITGGKRRCRACDAIRQQAYRERKARGMTPMQGQLI